MSRAIVPFLILLVALAPVRGEDRHGRGEGRGQEGHGRGEGRGQEEHGRDRGHGDEHRREAAVRVFRQSDRAAIAEYYRSRPGGLPPGLARRGDLPPGLERQLRRNGTLPPGLAKRFVPFPRELEMRLPPCPPDVRRGFIGGVAVMWNSRTGLVVDAAALFGR